MIVTTDMIQTQKLEWVNRIEALEQEAGTLNTRLQAIYTEIQQLRGATQACDVFLVKLESDNQSLPKDE